MDSNSCIGDRRLRRKQGAGAGAAVAEGKPRPRGAGRCRNRNPYSARRLRPGGQKQSCGLFLGRNILAHIPHKDKDAFAQNLKTIWLAPTKERARRLAEEICRQYEHRFPKAIRCLEDGLEDSLSFYAFPQLDARKISFTNVLERLNRESRRRTGVVGIFPSADAYTRLVTTYLIEYAEDWSASRAYLSEQSVQVMLRPAA